MEAVAVTGATGHLGANLVPLLVEEGFAVRCLVHRSRAGLKELPVEPVRGDILAPADLERLCAGCRYVFHLAGSVSISGGRGGQVHEVNVRGTGNIARACRRTGARLIHCSSVEAFEPPQPGEPLTEDRPTSRDGRHFAYARSKADAQRLALGEAGKGLDVVVTAPSAVLGPRDFGPSHQGRVLRALAHRRLPCLLHGGFDWVDARDVARGMLSAARRGRRGRCYLLGGHFLSVVELARRWCEICGVKAPRLAAPLWLARLGALPLELACGLLRREPLFSREALDVLESAFPVSAERARRELGYKPRPIEETLKDTAVWFGFRRADADQERDRP